MAPARAMSGPRKARRRGPDERGVSTKASTGGSAAPLCPGRPRRCKPPLPEGARNCACEVAPERIGLHLELLLDLAVARVAPARQDRLSSLRAFRHPNFVRFSVGAFVLKIR